MAIMGILTAIKKSLSNNLIIIKQRDFLLEDVIRISTNFKNIDMDISKKLVEMGKRLSEVYFNLFIFENHFRSLIENVSLGSYGKDYWDKLKIKNEVKVSVKRRIEKEKKHKWASVRGDSKLFYTDFDDLRKIIISNWETVFKDLFPTQMWISSRLNDLYELRNRIAHNNPIKENERNTIQSIINNIYNQLDVNLEYVNLFKESTTQIKIDDEEEFFQDGEEQLIELKEIDFDLIFNYLKMIEKGEIPEENLNNTFRAIDREIQKVSMNDNIIQEDLKKFEEICKHLLNLINIVDERFEYIIIGLFYSFTYNDKTSDILENHCYSYFTKLFEKGKFESDLIRILDKFGYFNDKIEAVLLKTIRQNGIEKLNSFIRIIDFSRYRDKRIKIIRKLNQILDEIDPTNINLKEAVKSIIRKFE